MIYRITDFGASPAATAAQNRQSIQYAINTAAAAGGGTVFIPAGRFVTANLRLFSNIRVELSPGAILAGSSCFADYTCSSTPYPSVNMMGIPSAAEATRWCALLYAEDAEQIEICGSGTLEGTGMSYPDPADPLLRRPMLLFFESCTHVRVSGVTLKNPSMYAFLASRSRNIMLDQLQVYSTKTENGDGLDFNGCSDVIIRSCFIESGDDAISLKTTYQDWPCRNILISNCILRAVWSGFRMGTESTSDMRDILLSNCFFDGCSDGAKIQDCAAGVYENIRITNVTMRDVHRPVFMTVNSFRLSKYDPSIRPAMGGIRDVVIDGLTAYMPQASGEYQRNCFVLSGCPKCALERITLRNMRIVFKGASEPGAFERIDVPEYLDYSFLYADIFSINGGFPAAGIFMRHIHGLTMSHCDLVKEGRDPRPMLLAYDLRDARLTDISAAGVDAFFQAENAQVQLTDCRLHGEAAEVTSFPEHLQSRYADFMQQTAETDRLFDLLAETADQALACPVQHNIEAPAWDKRSDVWKASISLSKNAAWLLLVSFGDVEVWIDGVLAAQCRLVPLYRNLCVWAVKLQKIGPRNAEVCLKWLDPSDQGGPVCKLPFGAFAAMTPGLYGPMRICEQEEPS